MTHVHSNNIPYIQEGQQARQKQSLRKTSQPVKNCQKLLTEDASPELAEAPLCRSVCISKTSEDIMSDKSSAYIQFPDSGDGAEKNS